MASQNKQVNQFDLSGKCLEVGMPEEYTASNGTKKTTRSVVMEVYKGKYANPVQFRFDMGSMSCLKDIKAGDWITVTFLLGGRKNERDGNVRYYNSLEGIACIKG